MAIFAVPLGMPVKKPFVTTLKARGSAAFSHEAEDLVVFSPHLYKIGCSDKLVRHARPTRINLKTSCLFPGYSLAACTGTFSILGPIQTVWMFTNSCIPKEESSRP